MKQLILVFMLGMSGWLCAQDIVIYASTGEVMQAKQILLAPEGDRSQLLIVPDDKIPLAQVDSIKVGKLLFGVVENPKVNGKDFVPLVQKHPGVWTYGKPQKGEKLLAYGVVKAEKEKKATDSWKKKSRRKFSYLGLPGKKPVLLNRQNVKTLFPDMPDEIWKPIRNGLNLRAVSPVVSLTGVFFLAQGIVFGLSFEANNPGSINAEDYYWQLLVHPFSLPPILGGVGLKRLSYQLINKGLEKI